MTEQMTAPPGTRITGLPLWVLRCFWAAIVLLSVSIQLMALPIYYESLSTTCADTLEVCLASSRLTPGNARILESFGISLTDYAIGYITSGLLFQAVWVGIGLAIFVLRSDDWMAALVSLFLIVFITILDQSILIAAYESAGWLQIGLPILGELLITLFFLLFPNGRLVPRWFWWLIPVRLLATALVYIPSVGDLSQWVEFIHFPGPILLWLFAQVYRYRRVSTARERYQTRWVFLGIVIALCGLVFVTILTVSLRVWETWAVFIVVVAIKALMSFIPITVGIAMLRANLFDVDIIIRRTTTYSVLTGILVITYFGSVIFLQRLLAPLTGESDVSVVLSTLLIAVLFLPLRRGIQNVVDRRFYRRKYDSEKVLSQFATTVRDETDLDALTAELIRVIQETMQPEHVSVWLSPTEESAPLARPPTTGHRSKTVAD